MFGLELCICWIKFYFWIVFQVHPIQFWFWFQVPGYDFGNDCSANKSAGFKGNFQIWGDPLFFFRNLILVVWNEWYSRFNSKMFCFILVCLQSDLEFVKKFTRPNFRVKEFYTLKTRKSRLFSPAINSANASLSAIWPSFGLNWTKCVVSLIVIKEVYI